MELAIPELQVHWTKPLVTKRKRDSEALAKGVSLFDASTVGLGQLPVPPGGQVSRCAWSRDPGNQELDAFDLSAMCRPPTWEEPPCTKKGGLEGVSNFLKARALGHSYAGPSRCRASVPEALGA